MARRRAQAVKKPTAPRGPQGSPRARINRRRAQAVKRPTSPQGPRGPMGGMRLAQRNAMQRQLEAAARSQAGRGSLFGTMGNVAQRPIPNRDGRMANMAQFQADAARANIAAARRPSIMGSLGQSNYARQPMPAQQLQRGMGRGPMPRANIGQIQAPRPTFGQQMRPIAPGQRLSRRRVTPRRR